MLALLQAGQHPVPAEAERRVGSRRTHSSGSPPFSTEIFPDLMRPRSILFMMLQHKVCHDEVL